MIVALYAFGREVLSLSWSRPTAQPEPVPVEDVRPDAGPFGFGGGTFGLQERAYQPDTERPIDTLRRTP